MYFEEFVKDVLTEDDLEIGKEAKRVVNSRQGRVYDLQIDHTQRLLHKSSNRNIHGLPSYLDSFKPKQEEDLGALAKSILNNSYDFGEENDRLKDFTESA